MNDRTLSVQMVQNVELARLVVESTGTNDWTTLFEHSSEAGKLRIESNQASLYATVHYSNGKPRETFERKPILDRTKLVVTVDKTTYILHDSGRPRSSPTPPPLQPPLAFTQIAQGKEDVFEPGRPADLMAAQSWATPENVAMIVAMLGAIVGVTTTVIKAIEAWLAHKASRRIRIKYEDFEVEVAGALSEEEILSRLKVFDHLRESLKKPNVRIELVE